MTKFTLFNHIQYVILKKEVKQKIKNKHNKFMILLYNVYYGRRKICDPFD